MNKPKTSKLKLQSLDFLSNTFDEEEKVKKKKLEAKIEHLQKQGFAGKYR